MKREEGKKLIEQRVEDFEKNAAVLKKKGHGETNIRSNYIDIFFEALGWNMKSHYDVHREFAQKDNSATKKVDYAFKVNGKVKFFVEAKEASVDLVNNKDAIYQAKRYAYSTNGKAPIVILTDFEEFRVFNVVKAPVYDNTDRELLKKFSFEYKDYPENWDLLWDTFSKEAVTAGSLDALRGKIDKNTKTMDADFLEQITGWRETLAKNIALRNKDLKVDEINEAVQRILDRLIFIRNLEDREIEPENTLLDKTKKTDNVYQSIVPLFRSLDHVYNGLLFKKHFSEDLTVDDKVLKDIIKNMSYPVSPFQFDVIEPEILGRIYEKFLGSKIRLTENHQAKIEEKMEVRKAGGVYYTPEYIVNYIVENTVGRKLSKGLQTLAPDGQSLADTRGLTPDEIKNIKICDPACGSGSFLLGAYSYLLDYHEKWYAKASAEDKKKYKADFYKTQNGEIKVTLEKRGDILRNNIFGVDIDKEATEVAIMSLYLKMLDEGYDKGERDLFFVKGHVLPDMTENVKCGNSLIGTDYFDGKLEIDMEEMKEIKPFDWEKEFHLTPGPSPQGEGRKDWGFDCVIGNPPYIRIQVLNEWASSQVKYFNEKHITAGKGNYDIFVLFIERGLKLLNTSGHLGYILPHKFFNSQYGENTRKLISDGKHLRKVVHFASDQVFLGATTYTCLLFLDKSPHEKAEIIKVSSIQDWLSNNYEHGLIDNSTLSSGEWNLSIGGNSALLDKLSAIPANLESVTDRIFQGLKTSADKIYILEERERDENSITVFSRHTEKEYQLEPDLLHPLIKGGDSKKYFLNRNTGLLILFPYLKDSNGKVNLASEAALKSEFPQTYLYLKECKSYLENRENGKMKGDRWYGYIYPKALDVINLPKIFTPDIAPVASYSIDDEGGIYFTGGAAGGYGILPKEGIESYYLLGLLNSRLLDWVNKQSATSMRGGWYSFESRFIKNLPIVLPEESKQISEEIKLTVDQMLSAQKECRSAKSDSDKKLYEQKISMLDKKIDDLVYKLYGLTEEDIKIVEGGN